MNAKTYTAKTIQEALDQIKRELGPEAVILSTQSIMKRRAFGLVKGQNWEITASAPEKKAAPAPAPKAPEIPAVQDKVVINTVELKEQTPRVAQKLQHNDTRIEELLDQITDLKRSVRLIGKAMPGHTQDTGGVYAELVGQGVDHEIADHLVAGASAGNPAPSELRDRVRKALAQQLIIDTPAEFHAKGRTVSVFVGPTGAGKTTTIAKLAGHAKVRYKKRVALISTDMYRVGGHEQLARYGQLLGIPTYACADPGTLKELIQTLDDRDLIMVDTPGSSPSDFGRLSKLEAVTGAADARVHLVIAASTRSEDITNIVKKFHRFSPRRVVITKIDETEPKGAFVGDILRNEMPISFLTNGQRVPEDLLLPSADDLARFLLPAAQVGVSKIPVLARAL
jgi:flagellar biosynthesis protein FlhF